MLHFQSKRKSKFGMCRFLLNSSMRTNNCIQMDVSDLISTSQVDITAGIKSILKFGLTCAVIFLTAHGSETKILCNCFGTMTWRGL